DEPRVNGSAATDERAQERPVARATAWYPARADCYIAVSRGDCRAQPQQVGWLVGEVGVHLEQVLVLAGEAPFEALDIGGAQPELARMMTDVQPIGLGRETVGELTRAVG